MYPVLTPMAVDASRPFPLIQNKTLNIVSLLQTRKGGAGLHRGKTKKQELEFATIQVPSVLPRLVPIPPTDGYEVAFILLEQIIQMEYLKYFLNTLWKKAKSSFNCLNEKGCGILTIAYLFK